MDPTKRENISKLLSEYRIVMDAETMNEDLLCCICHNLLNKACQGVCGCRYCYQCINEYLSEPHQFCPGNKSECTDDFLIMDRDVSRIERLDDKIALVIVLCPNQSCDFKTPLQDLIDHMNVCSKQPSKCPYNDLGCNIVDTDQNILLHIDDDRLRHSTLLMDVILRTMKDLRELKSKFEISILEIQTMKEELKLNNNRIAALQTELTDLRSNSQIKFSVMKTEMNNMNNEMVEHRNMTDYIGNKEREKMDNIISQFDHFQADIGKLETNFKMFKEDIERKLIYYVRFNGLCPISDVDFAWKIKECSKLMETKSEKDIYSESFYSNNYKLCLSACFDKSDSNIDFCCFIMKGNCDDKVVWPMKKVVTLAILDQNTLKAYQTVSIDRNSYKYDLRAFDKPSLAMNEYGICELVINYWSIKDLPSIIVNDSIIVSCALN